MGQQTSWVVRLLAAGVVSLLAACGGGGGDAGRPPFGGGTVTPQAANLTLNLSAPSINNSGSGTITATAVVTNENNQVVAGVPVVLSVDSGAEITVAAATTDAAGQLVGTVRIGDNRNNRAVTVTASTSNGLTRTRTFQVVGASLTGTPVPAVLAPGAAGEVKYRLVDANSNPMAGVAIVVTGAGAETSGVTGINGEFDYTYTAPAAPGTLDLRAAAGGAELLTSVLVQPVGGGSIPPVTVAVRSASLSANPSVVPVNTATTTNQSQVRALFLGDNNAPVANVRVRFDLDGDANSIGGSFNTGSSIVYSDANGVATASYRPGTRASPTEGLTVRACWDRVDFPAGSCPNAVRATLTITADPVSVSIGTNNLIETGASGLTYVKRYIVQVVDASGLAKPDVTITPSIDLLRYEKGYYELPLGGDTWVKVPQATCDNEDINRNNTNEVYPNGQAEDANGSFNLSPGRPALEPRRADVAISVVGSNRTDDGGSVVIKIEYPQDLGTWVEFNILVAASGVSATEGRANYQGVLPVPGPALKDVDNAPPFVLSPYGVQTSPVTLVTAPDGRTGLLCTNPN